MIRILLADDHIIVRNGLKKLLEEDPLISIVGEASNGTEVLQMIGAIETDLILADMNMFGMTGIELTEKLKGLGHKAKVILLTIHAEQPYVTQAFKAGVSGYLYKGVNADELLFGIKHVYRGQRYVCNELALRLLDQVLTGPVQIDLSGTDVDFSEREINILKLIAEGYTNYEIADRLFTSKRTVEGHRLSMISKTGVRNTAALIKLAVVKGIV